MMRGLGTSTKYTKQGRNRSSEPRHMDAPLALIGLRTPHAYRPGSVLERYETQSESQTE